MNYIDEIFSRANIQQIRAFLLRNVESGIDPRPYKERLESVQERMLTRLREEHTDTAKYEEITGQLFEYVGVVEAVYMEIGLQVGTVLAAQGCQNLKNAFEGE